MNRPSKPPVALLWMLTTTLGVGAAFAGERHGAQHDTGSGTPIQLNLNELYRNPVGPYGLEPTVRLVDLAGRLVRVTGYMVGEETPMAGRFLVTMLPIKLAEREDGPADDLPAATLFVHLDSRHSDRVVKYRPGPMIVVGTLEMGYREEADGRVSHLRLQLDEHSPNIPNGRAVAHLTVN